MVIWKSKKCPRYGEYPLMGKFMDSMTNVCKALIAVNSGGGMKSGRAQYKKRSHKGTTGHKPGRN